MTEESLPATTGAIKDATRPGETGEMALCAPFGLKIQCFPTTLNPLVNTTLSQRSSRGDLLPMAHALAGKTGFSNTQDYRNQEVEAAYAPVGDLGLGMVLKMDSAELHVPAWTQLRYLIPLLLGGLIIALLLLRWLLAPLVLRLVRSEARIAGLNNELEQRVQRRTAQLEAANRDLQEFAHSVAHDLRQPFIAIGGFIGLLKRSVQDERARHYVNRIKDGVRQAGELTDALLALANLSRVELRLQEVDLSTLAFSVMDKLQQQDPARVCRIHIEPGLRAQADAMLIRLVLEELLGNAWKFTSRRSQTEIGFGMLSKEAGTSGAEPVYVVRDNGEGFDMAHADKLFHSFQRLHSPEEFSGVGVGLANIQRIVTRHGGRIWAESARGEGSEFFFTLGNARP